MQTVLKELVSARCLVYQDNGIVFGTDYPGMLDNLVALLDRIRDSGLTLNPNKYEFSKSRVAFMWHIVSAEGTTINSENP